MGLAQKIKIKKKKKKGAVVLDGSGGIRCRFRKINKHVINDLLIPQLG